MTLRASFTRIRYNGSLLLMDIEADSFAREHPLKQRSQLFGWGQIGIPSPISPKHHVRLQPPSHHSQGLRPRRPGSPFFPFPPNRREDHRRSEPSPRSVSDHMPTNTTKMHSTPTASGGGSPGRS